MWTRKAKVMSMTTCNLLLLFEKEVIELDTFQVISLNSFLHAVLVLYDKWTQKVWCGLGSLLLLYILWKAKIRQETCKTCNALIIKRQWQMNGEKSYTTAGMSVLPTNFCV